MYLDHEDHVVNEACMSGHARVESDLSEDENNQLAKCGRMRSTAQSTQNGVNRLFMNRTYDSSLIYRVIYKYRTLQFGDSSDCVMRMMDLGN